MDLSRLPRGQKVNNASNALDRLHFPDTTNHYVQLCSSRYPGRRHCREKQSQNEFFKKILILLALLHTLSIENNGQFHVTDFAKTDFAKTDFAKTVQL